MRNSKEVCVPDSCAQYWIVTSPYEVQNEETVWKVGLKSYAIGGKL
jgi:hypothetical protein